MRITFCKFLDTSDIPVSVNPLQVRFIRDMEEYTTIHFDNDRSVSVTAKFEDVEEDLALAIGDD